MTDSKLLSREDVASKLADFFGRDVDAGDPDKDDNGDLLLVREDAEGNTIAVTSFGNKVKIDGDKGEVELLMGPPPGGQSEAPVTPPPVVFEGPTDEAQGDLPPLEGTSALDEPYEDRPNAELEARDLPHSGTKAEMAERLEEDDVALEDYTKDELLALADERDLEIPSKATKADIIEALEAE